MSETAEVAKAQNSPQIAIKNFFTAENVKGKFQELLGKKTQGFITSLLQCVAQNDLLAKCDPQSIYQSAMMAATLDLPINQSLGFAYIIPYGQKQKDGSYKQVAQFQIGYKGFIQLSQRSGQFKTISAAPVFDGQLKSENPLMGFEFDFTAKTSETIIGYAAYFQLINGFEKTLYMSAKELTAHGARFSQSFKKGWGLWKDDFNSMAQKTVIKLLLSKFAPLSIEMQKAVTVDQSIINDVETEDIEYVDNSETRLLSVTETEVNKLVDDINECKTADELNALGNIPDPLLDLFNTKMDSFKSA